MPSVNMRLFAIVKIYVRAGSSNIIIMSILSSLRNSTGKLCLPILWNSALNSSARFRGYASVRSDSNEVGSFHAMLLLTDSNAMTFFPHAVCVRLM